MSVDAEHAQASPRGGAGRRALAAAALAAAALTLAACSSPATLAKHSHLVNIPLAVAALMVVYHVPGIGPATHLKLDGKLLGRIYAGQITRWDDPSIAWPRQPGELSAAGTDAMISSVKSAPGSIGYVGVSYLSQVRTAGEGEAALGNSAGGYVLPAAGTIRAALASFTNTPASETISLVNGSGTQAYPIVNYEYAIVSTAQTSAVRAQDLRAFLSWAITSGAAQLARVNFQPLPSSVVILSGAQIAKIKADT